MLTDSQRQLVIDELKTWIGTPYRGWSCVKGAGVDCGQLIYGVFRACGFLPELKLPTDYSLQVSQHRASSEYVDLVASYCDEITEEQARPGDLVIYKLGHAYAHGAFIVEWPSFIIQAEARHGVSGAHGTRTSRFSTAPRKFFTLKDEYCGGAPCQ
jgi:cell wall-associated NlpC family hydrolase